MISNFNAFRDLCHTTSHNAGWWKNAERYKSEETELKSCKRGSPYIGEVIVHVPVAFDPDRLNIPTKLVLVSTEVREAYDYYLNGENDDHLPQYPGAAVELGDVQIRVGDLAGYLEIDMDRYIAEVQDQFTVWSFSGGIRYAPGKSENFATLSGHIAILFLHNFVADAAEAFRRSKTDDFGRSLARIVVLANLIAERNGWNLLTISEAKVAYNATRADHKAEARAAAGGKII